MRSEVEIKDMKELFTTTGDDSPAINTAVRDTLAWVLGGICTDALIEDYFVPGGDFQCFTCPAGWSGETSADGERVSVPTTEIIDERGPASVRPAGNRCAERPRRDPPPGETHD